MSYLRDYDQTGTRIWPLWPRAKSEFPNHDPGYAVVRPHPFYPAVWLGAYLLIVRTKLVPLPVPPARIRTWDVSLTHTRSNLSAYSPDRMAEW